jgi:hypothetical protein
MSIVDGFFSVWKNVSVSKNGSMQHQPFETEKLLRDTRKFWDIKFREKRSEINLNEMHGDSFKKTKISRLPCLT